MIEALDYAARGGAAEKNRRTVPGVDLGEAARSRVERGVIRPNASREFDIG